ncbi:MAG TPA: CoA-acylating methylmalonate-semialdehyde dehydrogenase [Candidatus Dormibacteraeota bacterium]|nr:CoA-acylating methylmalonate-semialdehyde dehydrogenase [Candidatus Dormibacteraeota bacterium]
MTRTWSPVRNYVGGWKDSQATNRFPVRNPATGELLGETPISPASEVVAAVRAAAQAVPNWRRVPVGERIGFLFKLRELLKQNAEELSRIITIECGKTVSESRGELLRAIENVEVACGTPSLIQGYNSEDVAAGIDEIMIRQPIGICAIIAPFNFPAMIPFWFMPYALACGNTVVLKPSERVPFTMQKVFALIDTLGLPPGVLNLVNGGREAVDAILEHPEVRAVSFVGSSATARYVYSRAAAAGKRVQCQGGAKNPVVVLPDADFNTASEIVADSAFGCAGQRCLAASVAIAVGEASKPFGTAMRHKAESRITGFGLEEGVEMGPVITPESKARIEGLIGKAVSDGATLLVDGRNAKIPSCQAGSFVRPTVLQDLPMSSEIARTEIFGPVLSIHHADTIEEAIAFVNSGEYGNMASLFTSDGSSARKFRYEAEVGNVGINVGVAAPMAHFPFSGARGSFFGDLHGQGRDAIEFFTQKKVVVERWPKTWSRKF